MALLNILQFPDKRLALKAAPVEKNSSEVQKIIDDMFDTMHEVSGVGLAATQVNIQQRITVIDLSSDKSTPLCLINPEIITKEGSIDWEEGCLSFPGVYAKIARAAQITVNFLDRDWQPQTIEADDLLSVCIQHEIDHLDGITFYDHLSPLKQKMLRKKLEKYRESLL